MSYPQTDIRVARCGNCSKANKRFSQPLHPVHRQQLVAFFQLNFNIRKTFYRDRPTLVYGPKREGVWANIIIMRHA
ncbi:MAG: hypothetical protein ACI9UU_000812 [Candidatus Azotimanducaceae bacterium]|jgi:hypothetical protein